MGNPIETIFLHYSHIHIYVNISNIYVYLYLHTSDKARMINFSMFALIGNPYLIHLKYIFTQLYIFQTSYSAMLHRMEYDRTDKFLLIMDNKELRFVAELKLAQIQTENIQDILFASS